jgi:parallel beta-helix repeat protein
VKLLHNFGPALALGLLFSTAVTTRAATHITACGYVISAPGHYEVTADLKSTGTDCIQIKASDVTLKLKDHIITGPCTNATCTAAGIRVQALLFPQFLNNIVIRGRGLITGFFDGIAFHFITQSEVSSVTVAQNVRNGIYADDAAALTLKANVTAGNQGAGMVLYHLVDSLVSSNTSTRNGGGGLIVYGVNGQSHDDRITDNKFLGNGGNGIYLRETSAITVSENNTDGNGASGILVEGANAPGNTITDNNSVGNAKFDLEDWILAPCINNVWINNIFFTRSAACVD